MNNGIQVPAGDGSGTYISTIQTPAGRVSNSQADIIGGNTGSQAATLTTSNLPDHQHTFNDGVSKFYAVNSPNEPADNNSNVVSNYGVSGTTANTSGINNSGGILTTGSVGQSVNIMNPYQTINYIIFAGNTANISGIIT
jgi:microcystin-dependent protein